MVRLFRNRYKGEKYSFRRRFTSKADLNGPAVPAQYTGKKFLNGPALPAPINTQKISLYGPALESPGTAERVKNTV
jgi:hypothetical protein